MFLSIIIAAPLAGMPTIEEVCLFVDSYEGLHSVFIIDYGFGQGGLRKRSGQGRKRFYLPGQYFLVIFFTLS